MSPSKIQEVKNRFEIIGNHPSLNRAIEKAIKVAPTDISVLITGESGVGKEAFSKIIHSLSRRKHGNFIAVNCGAIPEGTIDSELFGHEKGSFTSAYESRKGYFETVNGGTIFLDEISELPLETQSRLLRVLESGEFIKVGSSKVQKTDIRLIAASNKDLLQLAQNNKFREDLYYRLSTVIIQIPPLRARKEDMVFLIAKFATDFAEKYNIPIIEFTPEAIEMMKSQYWAGNIRQLKNLVEQISILEQERIITPDILKEYLPDTSTKELVRYETPVNEAFDGIKERDILYKFLIDIKKDLTETKALIYEVISTVRSKGEEIESTVELAANKMVRTPALIDPSMRIFENRNMPIPPQVVETTPVASEVQEPLSLTEKEKEMIREALLRHRGKRKPAAAELGISERTLYRKIKEYGLEDL
ncbi:MAG TPA: sigma-54 dependent transcriptional regulator [Bacteroidia bacterium]|nr:sigma-54 dependent transcriptional regulator [Bacteroidia bacterium]HRS59681.1 sigma-54 dependent transcriptional regulator [Bacteroidia bacterium]HRU68602.1 sigma-54 dependent transcriptional regulator [Bacteroidia bacterium]